MDTLTTDTSTTDTSPIPTFRTPHIVAITGASSGMGYEAARLFARKGWLVFAGARRIEKIPTDPGITAIRLDVTDSDSNKAFVKEILDKAGHIDVLVNNAGYGEWGPACEISMEAAHKEFETNFFGAAELTQLVLKDMLKRHRGRIVNNGSIGGDVYMPLGAYYHATKAALQMWSDILDLEVRSLGVRSVVVQPGWTRSSFADIAIESAQKNQAPDSPFGPLMKAIQTTVGVLFNAAPATSEGLAEVIYKAAMDPRPKLRYRNSFADSALVHFARSHERAWQAAMNGVFTLLMNISENEDSHMQEHLDGFTQKLKAKSSITSAATD